MNESTHRLRIEYRSIASLIPYARNSNDHSPEQVQQIANSIRTFGFNNPVGIADNGILAGHGRVMAADLLGMAEVPCIPLDHLNEAERRAYIIADNKLAKNSTWNVENLVHEMQYLVDMQFDITLTGFDMASIDEMLRGDMASFLPEAPPPNRVSQPFPEKYKNSGGQPLLQKFGIPPFSIFDSRQGYWQERKRSWLALVGDTSATKEGTLARGFILQFINNGSSGFDPVLAEVVYQWFCPPGGAVLDPFGGEQTKGFVAGYLGYNYEAVEYRQDQVDVNNERCMGMQGVKYHTGDSNNISKIIRRRGFDLVFTSPPYYNLEVYSKDDMSALGTYKEFMRQYEHIFKQCVDMLADNRFLVVKVGEVRAAGTGAYYNFVGHNVDLFQRLGLHFYNEIILVNPIGTAAIRATKTFRTRKTVKTHQNVLIFYKGDPTKIRDHFPEVVFDHSLGLDGDQGADDGEE